MGCCDLWVEIEAVTEESCQTRNGDRAAARMTSSRGVRVAREASIRVVREDREV
jgi:hypothetical protein